MPETRPNPSILDWIQDRLKERTSWDGLTIIVISLLVLMASPLIRYVAWAGLFYGIWTLWKGERGKPHFPERT